MKKAFKINGIEFHTEELFNEEIKRLEKSGFVKFATYKGVNGIYLDYISEYEMSKITGECGC